MSESVAKHKAGAPKILRFGIFICSTSRYRKMESGEKADDPSGELIESMLKAAGHVVAFRKIISDNAEMIKQAVADTLRSGNLEAVIFCGGTGIASSDVTIETVLPFMEKVLPGFGEIFRRLSYDGIGSAAVLSRAIAGVARGKAFFCIPGSPDAVRLCLEKLILPEAAHIVKHALE